MMGKSLRLRLALAAALSIAMVLVIAGFGLATIFERHVVRRIEAELATHLRQLASEVAIASDGGIEIARPPSDPRFNEPLSGLYWEADDDKGSARLRSRSLWDSALVLPRRSTDLGIIEHHVVAGPGKAALLVASRAVAFPAGDGHRVVRLSVAIDRADVARAREAFVEELRESLAVLAFVLIAAAWVQISIGLQPLEALRRDVSRVRSGVAPRLVVDEPTEVMPLVAEVNSLLEVQDKTIDRARQRAADLAHGLKTPLQVLTMDAERLRQRGEVQLATEIQELASGMSRHVGRELSRARLQSATMTAGQQTPLTDTLQRLVQALSRGPRGQEVSIDLDVEPGTMVPMAQSDLMELAGNILDNAVKWAHGKVRVRVETNGRLVLVVEDDGPGVSPQLLASLGERGVRLDESVEGTGLGLAIAGDIAEAYGADVAYGNREEGGFRVGITFPAKPGAPGGKAGTGGRGAH